MPFPLLLKRVALALLISPWLFADTAPPTPPAQPAARTLHLSTTEARYDHNRSRMTLIVRIFTADLETALSARAQRKVSAADSGDLAPLALEYVRENLRLKSAHGEPQRLEWAGIDISDTHVWLFFEAPLPGGLAGARLSNTLLQEQFPDQVNSVELRDSVFKQTLVFARDTGELVAGKTD